MDEQEGKLGLSSLVYLFRGEFTWFLVFFGVYLLLVVVLIAKVANRDNGALRVIP